MQRRHAGPELWFERPASRLEPRYEQPPPREQLWFEQPPPRQQPWYEQPAPRQEPARPPRRGRHRHEWSSLEAFD